MPFWAVVTTQVRAEARALLNLERQGFACYAPRYQVAPLVRGKRIPVLRFLFPRYLFVTVESQWHSLLGTFGVSRLIMNGLVPSRLPDQWVADMRAKEHNGVVVLPAAPQFRIGQEVRITGGLFQGQIGLYQGMSSRQREIVLLSVLGRVELAPGDLD